MKLLPHQATKQKNLIATCCSGYNYKPTIKLRVCLGFIYFAETEIFLLKVL